MEESVTAFKRKGKTIYLIHSGDSSIHFVPTINWKEYLKVRLNIPHICKIFNTINEAQQQALV